MTARCLLSCFLLPKGTLHVSGHRQTGGGETGRSSGLTGTLLAGPSLALSQERVGLDSDL